MDKEQLERAIESGDTAGGTSAPVDPRLLELLVCPVTKTRLTYRAETGELISAAARLAFPIRDGVPLMIVDAARELDENTRV